MKVARRSSRVGGATAHCPLTSLKDRTLCGGDKLHVTASVFLTSPLGTTASVKTLGECERRSGYPPSRVKNRNRVETFVNVVLWDEPSPFVSKSRGEKFQAHDCARSPSDVARIGLRHTDKHESNVPTSPI